jgi:hypothetical protein
MNNCVVNPDIFKSLTPGAQHIAQHDLNGVHAENIFKNLLDDAMQSDIKTGKEFEEFLRPFEEEILDVREANGEKVKKSDGSYCYSKVSQKSTYRSNKSVICKALDNGVPLRDIEGAPMGKTALEKAYKEIVPKSTMSAHEKAQRGVTMIAKAWPDMNEDERQIIDTMICKALDN